MSKRFDLYGWKSTPLIEAAGRLEGTLGLSPQLHESSYLGGDYYRVYDGGFEELTLQANFEDEDGYLAESDFPTHGTLLYVTGPTERINDLLRHLDDLTLLRTELK